MVFECIDDSAWGTYLLCGIAKARVFNNDPVTFITIEVFSKSSFSYDDLCMTVIL